jgi:para-nitrobenzyl esterase
MVEMLGEDVTPPAWTADAAEQERVRAVYERNQDPASVISAQVSMDTDRVFRVPSLRIAEAHQRAGGSTRVYRFDWRSPALGGRAGASHGLEVPFVFGDFSVPMTKAMVGDDAPESLTQGMHGSWVSFATSGDPAATGAVPTWPEYEPNTRKTMVFNDQTTVVADPDGEQRASWDNVPLPS